MENGIKDTSRMICVMAKAALNGAMGACTKAHGAKANNMVSACSLIRMGIPGRASGTTAKNSAGSTHNID